MYVLRVRSCQSTAHVAPKSLLNVCPAIAPYNAARGRLLTWPAKICSSTAIDDIRPGNFRFIAHAASPDDALAVTHDRGLPQNLH